MPTSRMIAVNGIELFLREEGNGPLVVLCHGWPELSYSWRHQIAALAGAGFHVVAPDMRGFGQSSAPADIAAYSIFDLVGDMVALVAALGESKAAIVGHDWGAPVAWHAALFRPDLFTAVAGLSVPPPFRGRGPPARYVALNGITNFYWQYFQTPGVAEAELERDVALTMRNMSSGAAFPIRPPPCSSMPARASCARRGPTGRCRHWLSEDRPCLFRRKPTGRPVSAAGSTGIATSIAIGT